MESNFYSLLYQKLITHMSCVVIRLCYCCYNNCLYVIAIYGSVSTNMIRPTDTTREIGAFLGFLLSLSGQQLWTSSFVFTSAVIWEGNG